MAVASKSQGVFITFVGCLQGSQLSWNSWNFTDVLKLEIVLKFYSFGENVLKLTFVMLS